MKPREPIRSNEELTSRELRLRRRRLLSCSYCRPHRSENAKGRKAHGRQKPRSRIRRKAAP